MSLGYLIRRIFLLLVIIWCAATLNFFVPRMTGGDPVRSQLMQQAVSGGGVQAGSAKRRQQDRGEQLHRLHPYPFLLSFET